MHEGKAPDLIIRINLLGYCVVYIYTASSTPTNFLGMLCPCIRLACNAMSGQVRFRSSLMLWLCTASMLLAGLGGALAAPNLDKMHALALERYGKPTADLVQNWRKLIEESRSLPEQQKLEAVNTFINRKLFYEVDLIVWKQIDHWATPLEFMGRSEGDCEDFAIIKYMTLLLMDVPADKLRMIYVRAQSGNSTQVKSEAHMVLGYYDTPTAEPLILDNLVSSIRPGSRRPDLTPVFSFNTQGLWVGGAANSVADPTTRLSRWRDLLDRMKQEGL